MYHYSNLPDSCISWWRGKLALEMKPLIAGQAKKQQGKERGIEILHFIQDGVVRIYSHFEEMEYVLWSARLLDGLDSIFSPKMATNEVMIGVESDITCLWCLARSRLFWPVIICRPVAKQGQTQ